MVPATCWHVAPLKYGNGIRILTRGRSIEHRNLLLPSRFRSAFGLLVRCARFCRTLM